MGQDILAPPTLYYELETLRKLSEKDSIELAELAVELGVDEIELKEVLSKLAKSFLIKVERERVVWLHGDSPSRLHPWGWKYIYKVVIGSTMLTAKRLQAWSAIVAEYQLRSYGRHGKRWISNLGGIWLSCKLQVSSQVGQLLPVAIPVKVCSYLRERLGINVSIKWPNDIVYKEKKLAGILLEGELLGDKMLVTVGLGINANNDPPLETATSIKVLLGRLIPRNSIIAALIGTLGRIEELAKDYGEIQAKYIDLLDTLGKRVVITKTSGEVIKGVAKSVTDTGELVVETPGGVEKLSSSEAFEVRHSE